MRIEMCGKKNLYPLIFTSFLAVFIIGIILFNAEIKITPLREDNGTTFEKAKVTKVITDNSTVSANGAVEGNQLLEIQILSGEHNGEYCEAQNPNTYLSGTYCIAGTPIIIMLSEKTEGLTASVYNYDRGTVLWIFIAVFLLILCIIGRKKGVASAISLIFTFTCIIFLYLPLLYVGVSPFIAATIVCILTTVVTMLLIGGFSVKTICSIIGTIAGVLIAYLFASVFGYLSHISGFNVQDIESLLYVSQNSKLDISGLLYSGILIASLGAVMDVSISVASSINEIYYHNPQLKARELFHSGINVGRDMMGTMSNTLILAFTGGSVNTIIITYAYNMPYFQLMNQYAIAIEILRGLSGTLGVIMTVPLVSAVTSFLLVKKRANSAT